jgi:hypothetical protein
MDAPYDRVQLRPDLPGWVELRGRDAGGNAVVRLVVLEDDLTEELLEWVQEYATRRAPARLRVVR